MHGSGYRKRSRKRVYRRKINRMLIRMCRPALRYGFLFVTLLPSLSAQFSIGSGPVVDLYRQHCAICHGRELEGGLGGPLIGKFEYVRSDEDMARWIREGNKDLAMPAFAGKLSDKEIRSMVIYIREMRQKAAVAEMENKPTDRDAHEPEESAFRVETMVDGLDTPWSVAFLPDGELLITERSGRLRMVRGGSLLPPVKGIPGVWSRGQGGLLEVTAHPEYADNGWIYLAFSEASTPSEGSTAIVRGRIQDNRWVDEERIFQVPQKFHSSSRHHFGCRLAFRDGYLFFTIGDRGDMRSAQDPRSPNGRVHRIHEDGRIPKDNPFLDQEEAFPSSWTLGNRNAQGLDFHPLTGQLWLSEHGPRGGDEINLIEKGLNYGWPEITHGMNYSGTPITARTKAPGMEQPKHHWTPSIAVCGIDFYEGDLFPQWKHSLFVGGLASNEVRRLVIEDGEVISDELILKGLGRVRDVASGPDGALYLLLNGPGRLVRLVPAE